jgi:hypothetical protein
MVRQVKCEADALVYLSFVEKYAVDEKLDVAATPRRVVSREQEGGMPALETTEKARSVSWVCLCGAGATVQDSMPSDQQSGGIQSQNALHQSSKPVGEGATYWGKRSEDLHTERNARLAGIERHKRKTQTLKNEKAARMQAAKTGHLS